jgi:hypothetical protein
MAFSPLLKPAMLLVAVLAQTPDMERCRIAERCDEGSSDARASLEATGRTNRGKVVWADPMLQMLLPLCHGGKTIEPASARRKRNFSYRMPTQNAIVKHF